MADNKSRASSDKVPMGLVSSGRNLRHFLMETLEGLRVLVLHFLENGQR